MEEKTPPSKWKRRRRRGGIALAWLVSLIALYYGVADWRGRRAWNDYRQDYEAHVAPLDPRSFTPPMIPESDNFAATPFVQSWFNTRNTNFLYDHDARSRAVPMLYSPKAPPPRRSFMDLAAWQEALAAVRSHAGKPRDGFRSDQLDPAARAGAAAAVLEGLRDDDAALEELRAAAARPAARYPVVYDMENPWGILLPHLLRIKQTCQLLQTRACAELALGRSDDALADVNLIFYLADTIKTEPFLVSYLVRIACAQIAVQPIWEGLAEHRWNDAQLRQLQARLEAGDALGDMATALRAERAYAVLTVDLFRRKGLGQLSTLADDWSASPRPRSFWNTETFLNGLGRILPAGWYDQETLRYCQLSDDEFRGGAEAAAGRVFPRRIAADAAEIETFAKDNGLFAMGTPARGMWLATILHHQFMAAMLLPPLSRIPLQAAINVTAAGQAATACALERCRLANGQFPGTLAALVPAFAARLPRDVITGEPFKYRRAGDGRFLLYSAGWNESDDGGAPGRTLFDETQGDWVW